MDRIAMDRIGRYEIIGELGRGTMGVVYHAKDPAIGRPVALKVIRVRDMGDTQRRDKLRERLFREARSAGVLSHPNIVTIYDMDEVEGLAYIAMAYVNGPTLAKILASQEALSGTRMLRVLRQTASALDYAHGRGIVHRDIKPANIMTDEDGAVKVTDFGIAKIAADANLTDTQGLVGTPNYMSPEQVQGQAVDGRSDQFSLAVIAYEILTGERPFQGEPLAEAHRINSTLTPRIDEVLRRALSKKPEGRFPNCSNFVGALEMACAESRGWTTLTGGSAERVVPVARASVQPEYEEETVRRSRFLPVFMTLIAVVGIAGVVAWQAGNIPEWLPFGHGQKTVAAREAPTPVADSIPAPSVQPPVEPVEKPSPIARAPEPTETVKVPAVSGAGGGRFEDIWVTTNPPGAKAVFDDDISGGCETPCMLHGPSGVHHLTISKAGYLNEYRELNIGNLAEDVPLITMRQPGATLMLTTSPPGASIQIDGRGIDQVTPAAITLKPGSYSVTVQKGGRSQTQQVELQDSPVYVRIPLGQ